MDKIDEKTRADIKKMSDARLITTLGSVGVAVDQLEQIDRATLMDTWVMAVLQGSTQPQQTVKQTTITGGYDVELERRKFDFEVMKWEAEKTQRAADIRTQDKRDRLDKIHREQTLQLEKDSFQRQSDKITRRDSTVSRIKV